MFTFYTWIITAVTIVATIFNIKKKRVCFILFSITNICWITVDIYKGVWARVVLLVFFTGMNFWGYREWKSKKPEPPKQWKNHVVGLPWGFRGRGRDR